ncbi:beta-barrel assembly-enhancing protease [Candidatus Phycosocius bacilliformis]|uniref:Beta-barrel assembly-enhancing protease n=2 Tax=Candidatus Phycosocius bacilliformis TaxID=1445552 RepID=A0A2P2E624_9PROT|nr:beta-barrel assembly-enhancing protease [Candidatus Phycosocius bacilliformis]
MTTHKPISQPAVLAILPFALTTFVLATQAHAATDPRDATRLAACVAKAETKPEEALEDGFVWRSQGGAIYAEQCIAIARIEGGDIGGGAERLTALASAPDAGDEESRAMILSRAANAWMMIEEYAAAQKALDAALKLKPGEPDLLLDRARAKAGQSKWAEAQTDLTACLSVRPLDVLALRLRAETLLQQKSYDAAELDIAQALRLAPKDVDNWLVRGRIQEARRLGRAPD